MLLLARTLFVIFRAFVPFLALLGILDGVLRAKADAGHAVDAGISPGGLAVYDSYVFVGTACSAKTAADACVIDMKLPGTVGYGVETAVNRSA